MNEFKVRCKYKNITGLTKDKEYDAINNESDRYLIILSDDDGEETCFYKDRFEIVKEIEEVKEYTLAEVFEFSVGTRFKDKDNCLVEVSEVGLADGNKALIGLWLNKEDNILNLTREWLNEKFTKVIPKVSFLEAWKAQTEGTEVISPDGFHFKNNKMKNMYDEWIDYIVINKSEIEDLWTILEG